MFVASATRARLFSFTMCIFLSYKPYIPVMATPLHSPRQASLCTALDWLFYLSPGIACLTRQYASDRQYSRHLHSSVTSNDKVLTADACEAPRPTALSRRVGQARRAATLFQNFGYFEGVIQQQEACRLVRRFDRVFGRIISKPDPVCCLAPPI